ncbi:MAG: DUF4170 domain-containing protein [Alphaproteobacteria bacterium]
MNAPEPRYWIVGGEYDSVAFERLVPGTEKLVGPFERKELAEAAWRDMAQATRPSCQIRYTIAEEHAKRT